MVALVAQEMSNWHRATAVTVPRCLPGATVAILASGPSLTAGDVDACRQRQVPLIAVKDAIQLAPDAAVLYGCDARFWAVHHGFPTFTGLKYSVDPKAAPYGVQILRNTGETGLEMDPSGVRTGGNSTYQALNVAVHLGATRIVLLGLDLGHGPHGPKYFFGNRGWGYQIHSPYAMFLERFATLVDPLAALGITVVNASRQTALEVFPKRPLAEAWA